MNKLAALVLIAHNNEEVLGANTASIETDFNEPIS